MDTPVSNSLRATFFVHMIFALVLGMMLWLIPGRTLTLVGWVPEQVQLAQTEINFAGTNLVDAAITRSLGAALLALAYASFIGWRATRYEQVKIIVQMEFGFCVLSGVAVLFSIFRFGGPAPVIYWIDAVILVGFAIAWGAGSTPDTRWDAIICSERIKIE